MLRSRNSLEQIAKLKVGMAGTRAQEFFDEAYEVIVFGSVPANLDGPDSDIDILCIGQEDYKLKTDFLDLIVIPRNVVKTSLWLESELAAHVAAYGVTLKGQPEWQDIARIGRKAINSKHHRIKSFLKSLPNAWLNLHEGFRVKYSVKLRRETQRLILLEHRLPIPPTKILDNFWENMSRSRSEVQDRLLDILPNGRSFFAEDLIARIGSHFDAQSH